MKKKKAHQHTSDNLIASNKRARHNYTIEKKFEAGISLLGWEVKSIRAGKAQIVDSYVVLKKGEAWLIGGQISPLLAASTHVKTEPSRSRRLLLHRREINELIGSVERKGYTIVPLRLYWLHNKIKLEIALAKGKKQHDKRHATKERDWKLQKSRLLKKSR